MEPLLKYHSPLFWRSLFSAWLGVKQLTMAALKLNPKIGQSRTGSHGCLSSYQSSNQVAKEGLYHGLSTVSVWALAVYPTYLVAPSKSHRGSYPDLEPWAILSRDWFACRSRGKYWRCSCFNSHGCGSRPYTPT